MAMRTSKNAQLPTEGYVRIDTPYHPCTSLDSRDVGMVRRVYKQFSRSYLEKLTDELLGFTFKSWSLDVVVSVIMLAKCVSKLWIRLQV